MAVATSWAVCLAEQCLLPARLLPRCHGQMEAPLLLVLDGRRTLPVVVLLPVVCSRLRRAKTSASRLATLRIIPELLLAPCLHDHHSCPPLGTEIFHRVRITSLRVLQARLLDTHRTTRRMVLVIHRHHQATRLHRRATAPPVHLTAPRRQVIHQHRQAIAPLHQAIVRLLQATVPRVRLTVRRRQVTLRLHRVTRRPHRAIRQRRHLTAPRRRATLPRVRATGKFSISEFI